MSLRKSFDAAVRCYAVGAGLLALAIAGCGSGGGSPGTTRPPLPTPTPVGLYTPSTDAIYLGMYVAPSHGISGIPALETQIGRKFAMDMHYDTWTTNFPGLAEDSDVTNGRIPINSWNCSPTNAQIAAGYADLLIQTRALAIKSFGRPVFLRYLWDMNTPSTDLNRGPCFDPTTDNSDGTFSATEFIAAWQHMHAIFVAENVTNVIWVWCPAAAGSNPGPYYPGAAYVDWVGIDAYDTAQQGFVKTFGASYAAAAAYGKPILIAETGEYQAEQPAFFAAAATALQQSFPLVKGFVYFDATAPGEDWRLGTAGIAALTAFGSEPYVSATAPP